MPKTALTLQALWLLVGLVLGAMNANCAASMCSDSQWLGSILGLIAWGVAEVPVGLAVVFGLVQWLAKSAAADFNPNDR